MENRTTRLYTRVTPAERKKVHSLAKRCGLSVSEYIRQRAEAVSEELLSLLKDIRAELVLPGKDKEVKVWPPLDSGPLKGN